MAPLKRSAIVVLADAGGDDEGADIIGNAAGARRDEIGQRHIGAAVAAGQLLAQRVQRRDGLRTGLVGEDQDIVALAVGRPQADDAAGRNQFSATIRSQHRRASS